ncbi:MAG: hypothetical protein ACREPM_11250 [Gemmatimonadaceae bacterium]
MAIRRSHSATRSLLRLARAVGFASLVAAPFSASSAQVAAGHGFLLGAPDGSITFRGGWALASASSDIFSFTTDNLTVNRGDFSSPAWGADLAFNIASRTQVVISSGYGGMHKRSEFRHFIDNNQQPIEQNTAFVRIPVSASVKQYLTPRGRSVGRLAWIPARFAAYVGAGAGATWYEFKQNGDFIDFTDNSVFPSTLQSDGWAPSAHVFVGGEWSLTARLSAVTEARYERSHATLSTDFTGFGPIDLSGFTTTAGLAVRF